MEHWNWQHEQVSTFYPFLNSGFLGGDKFICVRCFEIIGEYSAAACTHSGAFLEQVITTNVQCSYDLIDTQCEDNTQDDEWGFSRPLSIDTKFLQLLGVCCSKSSEDNTNIHLLLAKVTLLAKKVIMIGIVSSIWLCELSLRSVSPRQACLPVRFFSWGTN